MRNIIFYLLVMLLVLACNRSQPPATSNTLLAGYRGYQKNCTVCHGADGKFGFGGAKNLATSTLDKTAVIKIVAKGKGAMAAYEEVLSANDLAAIADYVLTLRP